MMKRFFEFFKSYWPGILSGILIGTSYIPFPPWALAFCYTPVWIAIVRAQSWKRTFWLAWWSQFLLSLIGFHWIAYVSHEFGHLPWPVAIFLLLLYASAMHLYIPLAAVAIWWIRKMRGLSDLRTLLLLAFLTVLGEIYWPSIFPWNLGYPLYQANLAMAQTAEIIGFQGLSLLVHLSSAAFAWMWLNHRSRLRAGASFAIWLVLAMGLSYWGQGRLRHWQSQETHPLQVMIVQANIGNLEKIYAEKGKGYQQEIANRYFNLTREGLARAQQSGPPPDLIVWPESAYPAYLDPLSYQNIYAAQLRNFVREQKIPLLTGAYSSDQQGHDFNSMFVFDGEANAIGAPYHKTYLLVFGEYVPFGDIFPILKKWNPGGEGWSKGSGPQVMHWQNITLGPQICYESLYPDFTRELTRKGAEIIVNLTNDSWFGPTFEPHQHMIMTFARSIEFRRPVVRSTNTGISTVAQLTGNIEERSPTYQTWSGTYSVRYQHDPEMTTYARYGAWLGPLIGLIVLALIFPIRREIRRRNARIPVP